MTLRPPCSSRPPEQVQLVDVNGLPMEIDESRITEVHGAAVCGAAFNETSQLLCTCARATGAELDAGDDLWREAATSSCSCAAALHDTQRF